MRTDQLDYDLPAHLIAQHPAARRDASRLMVLARADRVITHHRFGELPQLLRAGDLLILNDTRVLPARLLGQRARTGGRWEGLFLHTLADGSWELLCQTRGRLEVGETIVLDPGPLTLTLVGRHEGHWLARPDSSEHAVVLLERHGQIPLPPYIRKGHAENEDRERYQTVYARQEGSVAAPTAGLHFTPEIFTRLEESGIERAFVTLHVGVGTFQPIKVEEIEQHRMHREWGQLPAETVAAMQRCRARGGRIVAVGTTSVRVLETAARHASLQPWSGETDLFIYPPYSFQVIDGLLTNFHLPRSTLLLLVGALAGLDFLFQAYQVAIAQEYRFFSYGDAMLIV